MTHYSTTTAPARFLLLGDCHAAPIGRAAKAMGIAFHGGPLGVGRDFVKAFADEAGGRLSFRSPIAEKLYRGHLAQVGAADLAAVPVPLVSTFGCTLNTFANEEYWRVYRTGDDLPPDFLDSALFSDIVRAMDRHALDFYRHAVAACPRVVAVLPPQRVPAGADPAVFAAAQEVVRAAVAEIGAETVDLRAQVTDGSGRQRPEFCDPESPIHGNLAFGRLVVTDLLARGL
ncbi:hypothetical protein RM844_14260 [Streptomyces sp. DSM 44915]|uniref:SGNH/GDSL hydrolase family protein n=1 Tax=Streptomyces chisholmiae TaxID=3075540 RepID=A0ABU2JR44_9ACTN|nr:hypothetical protein [Streptomyces sp. DSM 44915]MDT0267451.1 hypothetical protein [Streptomyces sp. DSM 44915]